MAGLALTWNQELACFDFALRSDERGTDFLGDDGLLSAMIISLFTDARAAEDDPLPDERVGVPSDLRGWWGDELDPEVAGFSLGSRLWLLWREKDLDIVVARAEAYAREALDWLTTPRARHLRVSRLAVSALRVSPGYLGIRVAALRPTHTGERAEEWNFVYDYENAKPVSINTLGV